MDLNYSTVSIFPIPIHVIDINDFDDYKDQLVKEIYQERDEDPIGRKISNYGGWQSNQVDIYESKSETLKKVIVDSLPQLKSLSNSVSMIVAGWKNINGPGNFNFRHNHPRSNLSGVLWIKAPKDSGNIEFESPQLFNRYQELDSYTDEFKLNSNCYMTYFFPPKEGRLLIWPSDLEHEVKENKSDEDRISYSFNISLLNEK